jgi:hypothetical protein
MELTDVSQKKLARNLIGSPQDRCSSWVGVTREVIAARQLPSLPSKLDNRGEAAIDQPLAVKGHWVLRRSSVFINSSILAMAASRVALSGHSIQEKTTVSSSFA